MDVLIVGVSIIGVVGAVLLVGCKPITPSGSVVVGVGEATGVSLGVVVLGDGVGLGVSTGVFAVVFVFVGITTTGSEG